MKVTVLTDGTVEMEVRNGDGQAALDLIRSLQGRVSEVTEWEFSEPDVLLDSAVIFQPRYMLLPPTERSVYDVLAQHPTGCHVSVAAEELGVSRGIANARLVSLTNRGFAERILRGTYRLIGDA